MMLSAMFSGGVAIYVFYAMQPYLLELYGQPDNYIIAGASAAIVAGAQIAGGLLVPYAGRLFRRRTSILIAGLVLSVATSIAIGLVPDFATVLVLLSVWAIVFAVISPIRQAYMNGIIPSEQRATVLSSDNLMNSFGGVVSQPALGKVADIWGYPASYIGAAAFQFIAIPFLVLARREKAESDEIRGEPAAETNE
jgi:MFS family permease